jgi:hypothetical protein
MAEEGGTLESGQLTANDDIDDTSDADDTDHHMTAINA